jgi:hypothetical protein
MRELANGLDAAGSMRELANGLDAAGSMRELAKSISAAPLDAARGLGVGAMNDSLRSPFADIMETIDSFYFADDMSGVRRRPGGRARRAEARGGRELLPPCRGARVAADRTAPGPPVRAARRRAFSCGDDDGARGAHAVVRERREG